MTRAFTLLLLATLLAMPLSAAPEVRFLGLLRLDSTGIAQLGGLSAIEVIGDGQTAWVLSDRGVLFRLRLERRNGRIVSAGISHPATVSDPAGQTMARNAVDAEGMAILPGGTLALSFEGDARIAIHASDGRELRRLPPPPGTEALPRNGSYEALAIDADGRLYTLAEDSAADAPTPLYRYANGAWQIVARLPHGDGYKPVGLDIDDRGRLYLLERWFELPFGFSTRVTRFEMIHGRLAAGERLFQTLPGQHANLEGLAVWRAPWGGLVATMVSDDNFNPFLASTLVEYVIPD